MTHTLAALFSAWQSPASSAGFPATSPSSALLDVAFFADSSSMAALSAT